MNNLINTAKHLPIPASNAALSLSSVLLNVPDRELPLDLRITAPIKGPSLGPSLLPIILLSHGHGPSLYIPSKDGYAPLRDFYAEHGFVVIQPTHLNSKIAGLAHDAPGGPLFWKSRVQDIKSILDQLDEVERQTPFIQGRLDRRSIAVVGHSLGAQTASLLLGARPISSDVSEKEAMNMKDSRIKAGVLLGAPGSGGNSLTAKARDHYHFPDTDFTTMTTPTLIIYGDQDASTHLMIRGAEWHTDPYTKSRGEKSLLTLHGGGHGCGGVSSYDAKETDDEDPDRLTIVQTISWAYLQSRFQSRFNRDSTAWVDSCKALKEYCSEHTSIASRNVSS